MTSWIATIRCHEIFFEARIYLETQIDMSESAFEAAWLLIGNLKVARQLGPTSWAYYSLYVADVSKVTLTDITQEKVDAPNLKPRILDWPS